MSNVYEFGPGFQEKILATLWREPSFYTIYQDCVKPKYFESEVHIDLARLITEYYEKYESAPTADAIGEEVRALCAGSKTKEALSDQYAQTLANMVQMDLSDAEYVKDKVVQFGRKQALTQAILDSVDDVQRGRDFERVEARINTATQVGQDIGDFGTFYFDADAIKERMASYDTRDIEKVPTGNAMLDRIMAGGLGRGELGIVIAPPGSGKTLSLVNFGASGKVNGKDVVHFSLEMSEERVAHRYDSHYTNKDFNFIKEHRDAVTQSLSMLATAVEGQLVIKSYPTRSCTVARLRSYLTSLKLAKGISPDVVIVDYPDLMRPTQTYAERRTELEILYEELRGVAQEFDCAVWGASQTNRGALAKEVVTIADLAESFGKAAVADFMIAISQTKEEKARGELRYYVAKSRNGESDATLHCDVFYSHMRITPNEARQEAFQLASDDDGQSTQEMANRFKRQVEESRQNEQAVTADMLNRAKGGADA